MARDLSFGVLVLQDRPWPEIAARVRHYEELGFDSVRIADHFVHYESPGGPWLDGWMVLAGLATQTNRIRLGPLITHAIYRFPAVIARQAMTLDHLSGGRLDLGLGTGASDYDWTMVRGTDPWPFRERVDRFQEAVEIIDRLLRDGEASFHGRHYRVREATLRPGAIQQPRPPLTIAASGPRMVRLAARYADVWITEGNYHDLWQRDASVADVLRLTRERSLLLSEEAAAHGRDPDNITRAFLAGYSPGLAAPWASIAAFEEFVGQYRAIGCTQFILPEPRAEDAAASERIVTEVIPRLRPAARA